MCAIADRFIAQIQIVELKNIIASGFTCIMHAHTAVQEVQFQVLETYFQSNEGGDSRGAVICPMFAGCPGTSDLIDFGMDLGIFPRNIRFFKGADLCPPVFGLEQNMKRCTILGRKNS